jgi:hypothetical protein
MSQVVNPVDVAREEGVGPGIYMITTPTYPYFLTHS